MIRLASLDDIDEIYNIYQEAKQEMRKIKNPQWGSNDEDYPNQNIILDDIKNKNLYLFIENDVIKGGLVIEKDLNREYDEVISNTKEESLIIHRLVIKKEYKNNNIAFKLMNYSEKIAINNIIKVIKGDTEIRNAAMNNLFLKLGYEKKGQFSFSDYPGVYNYYEKRI